MQKLRRRYDRICCALTISEVGKTNTQLGITKDLSLTGLFIVTKTRWKAGTIVPLHLSHRFWDFDLEARVTHVRPDGAGLQFVDPSDKAIEGLKLLIDDLLAEGSWYDSRRAALRQDVKGPVTWARANTEVQSQLRDLNSSGAFIETDKPPSPGASIVVYLPAGDAAKAACGCQATVVHRNGEGFGIDFVFPSPEFSAAIDAILEATEKPAEP